MIRVINRAVQVRVVWRTGSLDKDKIQNALSLLILIRECNERDKVLEGRPYCGCRSIYDLRLQIQHAFRNETLDYSRFNTLKRNARNKSVIEGAVLKHIAELQEQTSSQ